MSLPPSIRDSHDTVVAVASALDVAQIGPLTDTDLLDLARLLASQQSLIATNAALVAGEIARRSAPQFGSSGLAQRLGHRTPQELVRVTTNATRREAVASIRVGLLTVETPPWLAPVSAALAQRVITTSQAESIRSGLGEPGEWVSTEDLREAARSLCALAPSVDADRLHAAARELRDSLDEAGIADRESVRRAARSLRLRRVNDGMTQITWLLDPESAAVVTDLFDRATSPRRGGPRFVKMDDRATANRALADERTTDQLASDVFLELLRQGADADSRALLATGAPVLNVLVARTNLESRSGHGFIEGQTVPVSIATVERVACSSRTSEISLDATGRVLDLGRQQRLYSRHQRAALAVRDGGCRWAGCDRPPSWSEAHHTRHWSRDGGRTSVDDGILLCRHHHLLSHNNGWEITHAGGECWLVPPVHVDATQTPIAMPTKSRAVRELLRA